MPFEPSDCIFVKQTRRKGRAVFAARPIRSGTIIERVPVLVVPAEQLRSTVLARYAFTWNRGQVAIALGYGSLYNHSYAPNARYRDRGRLAKEFIALRDIEAGEEITINYHGDPDDRRPVDFEVV